MDEEFEVVIVKSAVLRVRAINREEALRVAQWTLNGERGYSEYAQDGWEIDYDCEVERAR
jgi:hypothetical protein